MLKIGNILYKDNLVNNTEVEYINYYKISEDSSLMGIDFRLPTLYVGWDVAKKLGEKFDVETSILNKEIKKHNSYWEFSFKENKAEHVNGVDMFARNVPFHYFTSRYTFINIDPIFNDIKHVEELVPKLISTPEWVYNYKDEMLYILSLNQIYGIDLKMYKYFNMDIDHIKFKLINNIEKIINDLDGSIHQKYYKQFPNFEDLKRYLVVLLSKE